MFENNVMVFFLFQFAFFISAYLLGNWYSKNGLTAWGLPLSAKLFKPLLIGIAVGILLYGSTYLISLALGVETIESVPDFTTAVKTVLPFAFGVFFTSFSEDILTRGLVFAHLNTKVKPLFLIVISAIIYLLNHIYRLNDGLESLLYIFLLGILFIIPVIYTKKLWLTGGIHWGGNVFFFFLHNVIQNQTNSNLISANYLFAICIALFIPIVWFLFKSNCNSKVTCPNVVS
ncbi:hypothetical protein FLJC2902T_17130 [Flavobacterium limnosediminis JC2902]|uniref:CAAX prenyl protease 2/Lysostaphin resistance protein A-like domain-containing protein n=2 Tax=Flavobacterium TaxID=237 RepID=V6SQ71_9FLAO|nr:hypothetical protein FLJC2902T_17130 [Flavobacterium limnosediminis JC2902]